jgi:hypothetical protein
MSTQPLDLRHLAEEIAEMGPIPRLSQAEGDLHQILAEHSTVDLVAERLQGDRRAAEAWLADVPRNIGRALAEPDEDHARLVTQLLILSDLVTQRPDAQLTEAFEALVLA